MTVCCCTVLVTITSMVTVIIMVMVLRIMVLMLMVVVVNTIVKLMSMMSKRENKKGWPGARLNEANLSLMRPLLFSDTSCKTLSFVNIKVEIFGSKLFYRQFYFHIKISCLYATGNLIPHKMSPSHLLDLINSLHSNFACSKIQSGAI